MLSQNLLLHDLVKKRLIIILLLLVVATLLVLGRRVAALDAAGAATAEGRVQSEVDVLLAVNADHERRDVHDLLADAAKITIRQRKMLIKTTWTNAPDVPLADENTGVVDGLGEAELEHLGLEAALKEIVHLENEHDKKDCPKTST